MTSSKIKSLLQDMRLVISNGYPHPIKSDYHVSARGVPYVSVRINSESYTFIYFATNKVFRIFLNGVKLVDIEKRNDVIMYFKEL